MSTRVLVTGAAGFIGRPAVEALRARGAEVHAVSSRRAPGTHDGVTWHRADLLDPAGTSLVVQRVKPTHLLHLAWDVRPGAWAGAGGHLGWLGASLVLLEQFAAAGGTRVVMAGSCAEYDWNAGVCSEASTPLRPATLYGTTKLALGQVLDAYARETGMSSAWARIFFTFGPGEHPNRLVASVIRSVLAGEPAACSEGRQVRDFLFVDDVASALVALLESPVTGPVNVGSGQRLSVADLARRVGDLMARPDLIRLGARAAAAQEAPLVVADVSRLTTEVGWTSGHTLDAALDETIAWWRERCAREVTLND
jgi:nucleoside-diphosphate-sugar epimerase